MFVGFVTPPLIITSSFSKTRRDTCDKPLSNGRLAYVLAVAMFHPREDMQTAGVCLVDRDLCVRVGDHFPDVFSVSYILNRRKYFSQGVPSR